MSLRFYVDPVSGLDMIIETVPDGAQFVGDKLANHGKDSGHLLGGVDEVDGDKLGIDFTPVNYTPDTAIPEATDVDHLAAHLAGVDTTLGSPAVPTSANKEMAAQVTAADGQLAVTNTVFQTPRNDSHVGVEVNGVEAKLADGEGNKASSECFFSSDFGVTAVLIKDIQAGDELYWNGSVALYELAGTDRLSFFYDI